MQIWKHPKKAMTHKVEDRQAKKHPEFIVKLKREGFELVNPPKKKSAKKKKKKADKK